MTDPTYVFHGRNRIYLGARAYLVESEKEIASDWAAQHIQFNPAMAWIVGRYAEAEKANNNKQWFDLEGLRMAQPSINHAPMSINHSARNIVGAYVASELVYPLTEGSEEGGNPFIESLAVFWKYHFPDEYRTIKAAHEDGKLFFSMECVPRALRTVGGSDDAAEYPYEGVQSKSYPAEINERKVPIHLVDPHFIGGALIVPPVKPGWSNADVTSIANFMEGEWEAAEALNSPDPIKAWEAQMAELVGRYQKA